MSKYRQSTELLVDSVANGDIANQSQILGNSVEQRVEPDIVIKKSVVSLQEEEFLGLGLELHARNNPFDSSVVVENLPHRVVQVAWRKMACSLLCR